MNCPVIPQLKYADYNQEIYNKIIDNKVLFGCMFELTYRCNLNCRHCNCNLMLNDKAAALKELSFDEIKRVLDELSVAGCLWLTFTGGEIFIREDFWDIYTYAKNKGFLIDLFTNGTLITDRLVDKLLKLPPFDVEISLYGMTETVHEEMTRVPGSFKMTLAAIRLLHKNKLPLTLKSTFTILNKDELLGLKAFAKELGVRYRYDFNLVPRLDGSLEPCKLNLSSEESIDLLKKDGEKIESFRKDFQKCLNEELKIKISCDAGVNGCNINPFGEVTPCAMLFQPSFNVRDTSLAKGLPLFWPAKEELPDDFPCRYCDIVMICEHCYGWASILHNNKYAVVERLCNTARLLAQECRSNMTVV